MEKVLNTAGLGVSGRQNELIELALTFQFDTVQVDMTDLIGRHDTMGKEFACQFLKSAKINIGAFELPVNLNGSDEEFTKSCEKLDTIFSLCDTLKGKRCRISIATSSDEPFQSNFERHRNRLYELGEKFAAHDMSIGLMLKSPAREKEKGHKFIRSAEDLLTLVRTVGHKKVGLSLDTWQWRVSGGGMDQISDIDVAKITELMMADVSKNADPEKYTAADRVVPGEYDKSFSLDVFKALTATGFKGPVSLATHSVLFANTSRDRIVHRISQTLDRMIAGQPLDLPVSTFRREELVDESEVPDVDAEDPAAEVSYPVRPNGQTH